ncbi:MAG: tetratricopeptide repeat protein [Syntrophobacteraceae bacterium]|jgi:tetratricopeptide (TPR) repeat protein
MSKLKILFGLLLAACITAGLAPPWCEAAATGNSGTRITNLRVSVKGKLTCLIFDAEGARPKQIGPPSAAGITVLFSQITSKLPDKVFKDSKIAAKEVKFKLESGSFEVMFREDNTSVSSNVRPGKNGKYTLALDLTPCGKTAEPQAADGKPTCEITGNSREKVPPIEVKKIETSELFAPKVSQQIGNAAVKAQASKGGESPRPAGSASNPPAFAEPDEKVLALYASANEKFENCSRNLVFCASQIIEAYNEALKAGPLSSQAPLAIYRSALANSMMGNYAKADKLFRQVTSGWPDHPIASRCWVGIGDIYNKKQSYLEAMEAFRWALRCASEKDDKAAAYYELGKVYLALGANKEALEMLENCIGLDPNYYKKTPDVFRIIGEAHFALGNAETAKEHLLRYVNVQENAPDQDIIMAKIAEVFLIQGELETAKKIYAFVHKYYTDSEGDLICRVRQGELTEKEGLDQAIKIYEDLRGKDLSPSLRRIVLMKLAALNLKRCDLAHSLDLMDEAFPAKSDGSSPPGTAALRERILRDLVRQYFSDKDFVKVVQLYDKYCRVFDSIQLPDVLEQIAESFASLKFYSNALPIYDKLIAKGQKKGDDLLLRCALYALRLNDNDRSLQFCKPVQSDAMDLKKSEILGHIFYRERKYGDAVKYFGKVFEKVKEFELDDPDSFTAYGSCLFQAKKFDEAIPVLQKALVRAKADDAYARHSTLLALSKCFVEQKQLDKAAETMEAAIEASGEDQKNELNYEISKLYIAAGQTDKAIGSLNRIKATEHPFWSLVAQQQLNSINMSQGSAVP